jgi:hypothetical protein
MRDGPNRAKESTLLIEIDVPQCEVAVITDLSTRFGTMLVNGLPKDAPLVIRSTCRRAGPLILAFPHFGLSSLPA